MGYLTVELDTVTWVESIRLRPVPVVHRPLEDVYELHPLVLVEREDVIGGLKGDHHRLYHPIWTPERAKILVHPSGFGAFVEDLHPRVASDDHHVVFLVKSPKESGDRNACCLRQASQGGQARGRLAMFDLGHHAQREVGQFGELGHGHTQGPSGVTHPLSDYPADIICAELVLVVQSAAPQGQGRQRPPPRQIRSLLRPQPAPDTLGSHTLRPAILATPAYRWIMGTAPKPELHVVDHPLVQHKLTQMRRKETSSPAFRQLLTETSLLLAYEVTRELVLDQVRIETPLVPMDAPQMVEVPVVVSILRAGNGLLEGVLQVLPDARVGHVGLYRDHDTLEAIEYYCKFPPLADRTVILVDPMLATGNSATAALDRVKAESPAAIRFLCLLAAPEGIAAVQAAHPDVAIWTAAVDERLNEVGYILPGLGDAGDRIYGTT